MIVQKANTSLGIETEMLQTVVQRLVNAPTARIDDGWSCLPLGGGAGEGLGLFRISGTARVENIPTPWSLVLQMCAAADTTDSTGWSFSNREGNLYLSGVLETLPGGLIAPRCLAVDRQEDGTSRIWLEEVIDAHAGPWVLERYGEAAHVLGRFNGAYLVGTPRPHFQWLSNGWLRSWIPSAGPALDKLVHLAECDFSRELNRLYPSSVIAELRRLWDERELFLSALDRLPQTFCHHDAFRRNLMHTIHPNGDRLVAIDWAYAGRGAVGEELVSLVVGSLCMYEAPDIRPHDLETLCMTRYIEGLREAGWSGDERMVRQGFTSAAALRLTVGMVQLLVPILLDPEQHPLIESLYGRPVAEVVNGWVELWPYQFALAEEARAIVSKGG